MICSYAVATINGEVAFDWDEKNRAHLQVHKVTPAEFEFVVLDPRTIEVDYQINESGEDRPRVVGMTQSGRMLSAVYTIRRGKIRAVTAFPATKREVLKWQKQNA